MINKIKKTIWRKRKLIREYFLQFKTARKMDKYIANFINGKAKYFSAIPLKSELIDGKYCLAVFASEN